MRCIWKYLLYNTKKRCMLYVLHTNFIVYAIWNCSFILQYTSSGLAALGRHKQQRAKNNEPLLYSIPLHSKTVAYSHHFVVHTLCVSLSRPIQIYEKCTCNVQPSASVSDDLNKLRSATYSLKWESAKRGKGRDWVKGHTHDFHPGDWSASILKQSITSDFLNLTK